MAAPGTLGSLVPPGEDAAVRKMADLQRELRELGPSVAASFATTVKSLQDQIAYQASLKTLSVTADSFTVSGIPGDGVQRSVDSAGVIYLAVPTGRALVTVGADLVGVEPGDVAAEMGVSFNITSEGGTVPWFPSGLRQARVFSSLGDSDNLSTSAVVPVSTSPDGVTKFVMSFSYLSQSLATLAEGRVFKPYMIVQVIPAV